MTVAGKRKRILLAATVIDRRYKLHAASGGVFGVAASKAPTFGLDYPELIPVP
jgi:hypothetical protein